jgi:alpha-L-arabinofuranosidase
MKKTFLISSMVSLMVCFTVTAGSGTLNIYVNQPDGQIPKTFYGAFFEDINYSADGGLYAELIQNRSFEYNPTDAFIDIAGQRVDVSINNLLNTFGVLNPLNSWTASSSCSMSVKCDYPLNENNPRYLEITSSAGSKVTIYNSGYDGISVVQGKKFNFSFFAHREKLLGSLFTISIVTPQGEVVGSCSLTVDSKDWTKYSAVIEVSKTITNGRLQIETEGGDKVFLDMVSLMPQDTFKGHANGLRPDLAQAILNLNPKFLRFPGGCVVHGRSIKNAYRWEDTVGPLEFRKQKYNRWGYYQSYGLGFFEYFQFCEDIGAEPVPCLPMGVTPDAVVSSIPSKRGTVENIVPIDKMQEWVQSALDLIEFANGAIDTKWGGLRASMGHPASFEMKYIGIGNEEVLTSEMKERYLLFHKAISDKYPSMKIIGTLGMGGSDDFTAITNLPWYQFMDNAGAHLGDEHYYHSTNWFFNNDNRFDIYPKGKTKMFIGEYASKGNKLINAVAEAAYLTGAERNGDFVEMTCYAPLLAKDKHTQWAADQIFFNNQSYYLTPNYHMLAMFGNNKGDIHLKSEMKTDQKRVYVSSTIDKQTGDLIVKLVNGSNEISNLSINIQGAQFLPKEGVLITLTGDSLASNSWATPEKLKPMNSLMAVAENFNFDLPAMSVQVLRVKNVVDATPIIQSIKELNSNDNLYFYPNPSKGIVKLSSNFFQSFTGVCTVKVIDMDGRNVFLSQINKNSTELDLSSLAKGVYTISIQNNVRQFLKKNVLL